MRIASLFLIATLRLVLFPTDGRGQQPAGAPLGMDSSAFSDLGLTPDQHAKIAAIRQQVQQENAPLREQLRQLAGGKSFRDLSAAERDSLRPKAEPIVHQMRENARKGRDQIMAILTPDQRKKFEAHVQEHRGPPPEEHN
jgi:Spy/CpxP family protein refolding chaperone